MDTFSVLTTEPQTVGVEWFAEISDLLLNKTEFVVAGIPHRFTEIEYYYFGGEHKDPFAHCDPLQQTTAKWYFHRESGSYRGGSFKGLDISFGSEGMFGGILIRTIEDPDGNEINGCSLCVDHLLKTTGHAKVADLDGEVAERLIWDESSPIHIRHNDALTAKEIIPTARVGLTLKRMGKHPDMPAFIMRNYRYLTIPEIKKGKVHTIIAYHKQGLSAEEIKQKTRSPQRTINGYIDAFDEGQQLEDFQSYKGQSLKSADVCRLHGTWHRHFATTS